MKILFLLFLLGSVVEGCGTFSPSIGTKEPDVVISEKTNNSPEESVSNPQQISVAILVRQNSVHLSAPDDFVLSGFPWETPVVQKGEKRYREVTLTSDRLYAHKAYIQPMGDGEILVNGKSYRGTMEIVDEPKGTLTVINQLSLEDYVMGVLAGEIPRNWPMEVLKAQAIAARTFAVLNRQEARQKGQPYDLENTALFQMYEGSELVNDKIRKAVLDTQDQILTYDNKPIAAFFHSNCGGHTCDSADVWSQGRPYLRSVSCPFGNNGTHFRWNAEILISDLVRKLRTAGLKIGDVAGIKVLSRDASNHILKLAVVDGDGTEKTIKGSAFRMALGPDLIRSTRFDAKVENKKVVFHGLGWGHGVGLCQEGAYGMAIKGYGAFDILRYYYHGIMVEKIKEQL